MSHPRTQIRDAAIAAIKAANLDGVGDNVVPNFYDPSWPHEMPVCIVYVKNEQVDGYDNSTLVLVRKAELDVQLVDVQSSETDDVDARLDFLARQVELALLPMDDITVGPAWQAELGIVRECSLQSVKMSGDEQAAAPIASQTLEFVVEWEDHIAPVVPGEGLDCAIEIRPKEAP